MPKIKIVPSILSADMSRINEEIKEIENYCDLIQVDVMDNVFVPNMTEQAELLERLKTKIPLDIHLMVMEPSEDYIQSFIEVNPVLKINNITIHREACKNPKRILNFIKKNKIVPSIAINPKTKLDSIIDFLDDVGMVLVMTVEPGFSGQKFIENELEKVSALRKLKPNLDIEVDGGVNKKTAQMAVKSGANVLVVSSYVFKSDDKVKSIKELRKMAENVFDKNLK